MSGRTFTADDQMRFAQWSGDHNPMHVDSIAARRTVAGTTAVHGMHTLLWLLDQVAPACGERRPVQVEARFLRFVPVGQAVEWRLVRDGPAGLEVVATLAGAPAVGLALRWTRQGLGPPEHPTRTAPDGAPAEPLALEWDDLPGRGGTVPAAAAHAEAAAAYPGATQLVSPECVAGLTAATRLVGMVCPGLHSIFSELKVELDPAYSGAPLCYAVQSLDERFRMAGIGIAGFGMVGALKTYMRQPPVRQPGIAALREVVRPDEFAGATALILGGSRGLGELTAKLLAAGGGDCVLSYASGAEDAARVAEEVRAAGRTCHTLRVDAAAPVAAQLAGLPGAVGQAYYFATTKIFRQGAAVFDPAAFAEFSRIYVGAFHELCLHLAAGHRGATGGMSVFYPSSAAVETRPRGMTEYAMAKAAGEMLCQDVARWTPGLRIVMRRLPRLLTDQTATTSPVRSEDAVATMLEVVRAMHAG